MIKLIEIYNLIKEEKHSMEDVLSKYNKLADTLVLLMGEPFRDYIDAVLVTSAKPATFKIHLKNHQFFYLTATSAPTPIGQSVGNPDEVVYEATVQGKRYLLTNQGNIQLSLIHI